MKNYAVVLVSLILLVIGATLVYVLFVQEDDTLETETEQTQQVESDQNNTTGEETVENTNEQTEDETQEQQGDVIELDISMKDFTFDVKEINAKAGDTVRLNLSSENGLHDFVIDEFDVQSSLLDSGESEVFEFTIPADAESGEYEYYCSFGSHRVMGMTGKLIVE